MGKKSRRKSRGNDAGWQRRLAESRVREGEVRRRMEGTGLTLDVSAVQSGRTHFTHWVFRRPGGRPVLHYWPTKGTWKLQDGAARGTAANPLAALEAAVAAYRGQGSPTEPAPRVATPAAVVAESLGLPARPDGGAVRCERCGEETDAEEVEPLYPCGSSAYWLCPRCAGVHGRLARV